MRIARQPIGVGLFVVRIAAERCHDQLIGAPIFDVASLNEHGDGVFVDDEGLFRSPPLPIFQIVGMPQPLAGRGLVLGLNPDTGESVEPCIDIDMLRAYTHFGPRGG